MENNLTEDLRQKHKKKRRFLRGYFWSHSPFDSPSKRTIVIVAIIWAIGSGLSLLAMTDLFRESPFKPENGLLIFLLPTATAMFIRILLAYYRKKDNQ